MFSFYFIMLFKMVGVFKTRKIFRLLNKFSLSIWLYRASVAVFLFEIDSNVSTEATVIVSSNLTCS